MRPLRLLVILFALFSIACGKAAPRHDVAPAGAQPGPRRTMLEIRVDLTLDVTSIDRARELAHAASERAHAVGGFVESARVSGDSAHLILRVPPGEIDSVRGILTAKGSLAHESRSARDVTDAVMDIDARTRAAKSEESRLLELLEKKTGSLADVLAVEKALSDVRERIERLEAEQRAAHGRVDLATVTVTLHAREEGPVGPRLMSAARDGVAFAREATTAFALTALRAGPTFLIVGGVVYAIVRLLRRRRVATA